MFEDDCSKSVTPLPTNEPPENNLTRNLQCLLMNGPYHLFRHQLETIDHYTSYLTIARVFINFELHN